MSTSSVIDDAIEVQEMPDKKRAKTGPRRFVESVHLSTLIASYNIHFAKYSEGRKNVTQLIPSAVWKSIYKDFTELHQDTGITEETLKIRVREELTSLKTGTSNENEKKAELQAESVLERLKMTPGHAKRNILKERIAIISGKPNISVPSGDSDLVSPKTARTVNPTKAQLLAVQSSAIERIATVISGLRQDRKESTKDKQLQTKLNNLERLVKLGIMTTDEMKANVKKYISET